MTTTLHNHRDVLAPPALRWWRAFALGVILLAGCAGPVSVARVDPLKQFDQLTDGRISADALTADTRGFLQAHALERAWESDPVALLRELDRQTLTTPERERLRVLMELCCVQAEKEGATSELGSRLSLACVVYAYRYLFDASFGTPLVLQDPHTRRAYELYNRALTAYLQRKQATDTHYHRGVQLPLLNGALEVNDRQSDLAWDLTRCDTFKLACEYNVDGLEPHYRTDGLGVPLIVVRTTNDTAGTGFVPGIQQTCAATAFLRVMLPPGVCATAAPLYQAEIMFCDPRRADAISANGRTFPLASDLTTPLAYMIAKAPEPASIRAMFNVNIWQQQQGLHMLQPYQPGRIPVVFVHGLMSSPIAWLQMLNTVMGDPVLNKRYQFWFFMYPTGNPVLYSASLLRASLHSMQRIYDPAGRDPAFSNMVVVSHSMGGLLARFIVQDSSPEYWNCLGNQPFDAYHLTPDEATLISNILFFTAVPYVARVAFLATPHRGSPYADTWYARIGARITSVQQGLVAVGDKLLPVLARQTGDANTKRDLVLDLGRIPTGIDSLRPENPVLKTSVALPFAPRVVYHSIMGNEAAANTPGGTDGIVPYWSSHLDGAASEMIVKSDHSVEVNPRAILEVRRLLLEHLAQTP